MKEVYTPAEADILLVSLPQVDVVSTSPTDSGGSSGGSGNMLPGGWG